MTASPSTASQVRNSVSTVGTSNSRLSGVGWEHLIAGVTGGVVSTLILHPLDLVKIRFQVNEGSKVSKDRPEYRGTLHAFRTIYRQQGVRGLYQGATPNVIGAGLSWGLYFFFYNTLKTMAQDGDTKINLGAQKHMLIAAQAGFATLVLTNPIWVTKTRLCLQYGSDSVQYKGVFDALSKIFKEEGFRGWYKGFLPGVIGISHGALQFMAYEEMKSRLNIYRNNPVDTRLNSGEYLLCAAASKMFAASATYPYQVLRSRLQDQHRHYSGIRQVIISIWRNEGFHGYYKGLTPNLWRVTPACAITFLIYENMITFFKRTS